MTNSYHRGSATLHLGAELEPRPQRVGLSPRAWRRCRACSRGAVFAFPRSHERARGTRLAETDNARGMVTYQAPGGEPLVLDNLDPQIRTVAARTDLQPVHGFNDDGLWKLGSSWSGRIADCALQELPWAEFERRLAEEPTD